jgi:chromosome segregation ATPase
LIAASEPDATTNPFDPATLQVEPDPVMTTQPTSINAIRKKEKLTQTISGLPFTEEALERYAEARTLRLENIPGPYHLVTVIFDSLKKQYDPVLAENIALGRKLIGLVKSQQRRIKIIEEEVDPDLANFLYILDTNMTDFELEINKLSKEFTPKTDYLKLEIVEMERKKQAAAVKDRENNEKVANSKEELRLLEANCEKLEESIQARKGEEAFLKSEIARIHKQMTELLTERSKIASDLAIKVRKSELLKAELERLNHE